MTPSSVKVGHQDYEVVCCTADEMGVDFGACDYDRQEIRIRAGIKIPAAQETLLHEVMHACLYPASEEGAPFTEERIINLLAGPLLLVLRSNPALVEYLTQ